MMKKYISEFMKKCAVYLILQKMCQDIGGELFRIQDTQMKYDRYGNGPMSRFSTS